MAISNKTRKILWGRSGNRCAICRQGLVVDETNNDEDSVVGDECHINSAAPSGPRYDGATDSLNMDALANLLLLCRVHHKMVDDQFETYTTDLLRSIKENHEKWVDSMFKEAENPSPVKLRRFKNEMPGIFTIVESGQELLYLATGCFGSYTNYSDDLSDGEVEIVGGFMQNIKDFIDIGSDLQPIDTVRVAKSFSDELNNLKEKGFLVFAASENQRLEGGIGAPLPIVFLHVSVVRESDASIIRHESP